MCLVASRFCFVKNNFPLLTEAIHSLYFLFRRAHKNYQWVLRLGPTPSSPRFWTLLSPASTSLARCGFQIPSYCLHGQSKRLVNFTSLFARCAVDGIWSLSWIFLSSYGLIKISLPRPPLGLSPTASFASPRFKSHPDCKTVKPRRFRIGAKLFYARSMGFEPTIYPVTGDYVNQATPRPHCQVDTW